MKTLNTVRMKKQVAGTNFTEVLNELHAHAFTGVPGESEPFTLDLLDREFIAYALSCYYQCDHCKTHHHNAILRLLNDTADKKWPWGNNLLRLLLFLRIELREISAEEQGVWSEVWKSFARKINSQRAGLACYIAYAIGVARQGEDLMNMAYGSISSLHKDSTDLRGVIADIDRVVVFMKAATSKNRTDPIIERQLASRGIHM